MQLDAVTQQHHSWPGEGQEPAWPHAAEADRQQPPGGASMLEEWSRRSTQAGMVASNSAALAQLRQRLGLPEQGPAELTEEAPSQLYEEVLAVSIPGWEACCKMLLCFSRQSSCI